MEQLIYFFLRICKEGLKINTKKFSFKLKDIPYLRYVITREVFKPDPNKIQGIMDLQCPKTTTNCRKLGGVVPYYWNMWKCRYPILAPITEASVGKKGTQIEWTKDIEQSFLDLKSIFSEEKILNYPYWTNPFTIHKYASDK